MNRERIRLGEIPLEPESLAKMGTLPRASAKYIPAR
jgi:hypothetical protein